MNPPFASRNEQRWMLVDDNPELLNMLSLLVRQFTNAVIECYNSPQAALSAFVAAPAGYELIITDFDMPGMNGIELCRQLRSVSAIQKVFLATGSGYFTEAAARHHGFSALLNKPFPLSSLQKALAAVGLCHESVCSA